MDLGRYRALADLAVFLAVGFSLILAGIIAVILAVILGAMRQKKGKSKVRAAGVVMIGPIPIIFGTDKESVKEVLWLALTLVVVVLAVLGVYYWLLR